MSSSEYFESFGPVLGLNPAATAYIPDVEKSDQILYENISAIFALGSNRGEHLDEKPVIIELSPSKSIERHQRRLFLNSLAYLLDYATGGDSVTAIALQQLPGSVVYWFASNRMPHPRACRYPEQHLETLLSSLEKLRIASIEDGTKILRQLVVEVFNFSSQRIDKYISCYQSSFNAAWRDLQDLRPQNVELARSLQNMGDAASSLPTSTASRLSTCQMSWDFKHSKQYRELCLQAQDNETHADRLETLRHFIERLSHTLNAVKAIADSAKLAWFEELSRSYTVSRFSSSQPIPSPFVGCTLTLNAIVTRLLNRSRPTNHSTDALPGLSELDSNGALSNALRRNFNNRNWKVKVHAEILLLDHFWAMDIRLVGNDPFIACSKDACYCRLLYFSAHPGGFQVPASRQNCYLAWGVPDVSTDTVYDRQFLENTHVIILKEMNETIETDIIHQLERRQLPRPSRRDSFSSVRLVDLSDYGSESSDPEQDSEDISSSGSV